MCTITSPRSYPRAFGKALATLAGKHLVPADRPLAAVDDPWATIAWLREVSPDEDLWADAKMDAVLHYLFANKHLAGRPGVRPTEPSVEQPTQ